MFFYLLKVQFIATTHSCESISFSNLIYLIFIRQLKTFDLQSRTIMTNLLVIFIYQLIKTEYFSEVFSLHGIA